MTSPRLDELRRQRADQLNIIDDILNTANGARLEGDERRRHDNAVKEYDKLDLEVLRAERIEASGGSTGGAPMPFVTSRTDGFSPSRSLDAMLWATPERTVAGSFSDRGTFSPDNRGTTNPVEQVVIRASAGYMLEAPRINEFAPERQQLIRNLQNTVADMAIFGLLLDKHAYSSADGFEVARNHALYRDKWQHLMNALDVDTNGEGANWVPTGIGAAMHEKVRAAGKVAPLFMRIDLPTNPWKWPIEGGDATAYRVAEPTSDSATKVGASTPGTVAATFDAEIFGARTIFSRSVDADSAVVMVPFLRGKIIRAFVDAEEKTILDGDSDGTHQDSDVQAIGATDVRTSWDGLRKKGLAQTSVNTNAATTAAKLLELKAAMGKWGVNPSDLAFIVGISAANDLIGDTNLLTVDKFGPNATILNGQVGSVYGVPVIVSEHVREDLNASGVHDGITETKTYNLCVNRNEWVIGQRMALDVEVDDSIYRESFQRLIVGFSRQDVQHIGDAAANDDTAVGYGVG